MTEQTPESPRPSFGDRLSIAFVAFVRALVRLLLVVVFAGLIGLAFYAGVPWLYRQYVIPVEENTDRIVDLDARLAQQSEALGERIDSLRDRLDTLEVSRDQDRQTVADLRVLLDDLMAMQAEQSIALEQVDELQATAEAVSESQERLESFISAIATQTGGNRLSILELEDTLGEAGTPLEQVRRELQLVKAMELLTRSRLFIAQGNPGLAQEEVTRAYELLSGLHSDTPPAERGQLVAVLGRLQLALVSLPDAPALAIGDLDAAWRILLEGLPEGATPLPITPAPFGPTFSPTGELTPPVTITPTPTPPASGTLTPIPSPTPTPTPAS